MDIKEILLKFKNNKITLEETEKFLKVDAIQKIGNLAVIDVNRQIRRGIMEIIFAEGKTAEDLLEIINALNSKGKDIIISRLDEYKVKAIKTNFNHKNMIVHDKAHMITIINSTKEKVENPAKVGIITAGTSDIPIAEESRIILEYHNCEVLTAYDIGVAGIHRLFPFIKEMIEKDVACIIVVAGMEGALPSIVAGLVDIPVIGVPTSIGYGEGGKGKAALYSMLQSCSTGLTVVNIDNGISAGISSALIARNRWKK